MRVVLLLARGEVNFHSAISSLARVLEESGAEEALVLYPPGYKRVEELRERFEGLGIKIIFKERKYDDKVPLRERLEELKQLASPDDLAIVSPAGASLSAVASKYFKRIAHVTFPFGAWSGNTYPYVLRQLQKVYTLGDVEPGSFKPLTNVRGALKGGPIRRRASELVKRVNEVAGRCFGRNCPEPEMSVELSAYPTEQFVGGQSVPTLKIDFTPSELKFDLRTRLNNFSNTLKGSRLGKQVSEFVRTLLQATGVFKPKLKVPEERKAIVLDTSAIFYGLWNWHYLGYPIRVPRCAVYELLHKYEEGVKPSRNLFKLESLLAKFLADEVREVKLEFPSPPDLCDKAFLQMDPFIIFNTYIATGDNGIRMLWKGSPLERLAELLWVSGSEDPSEFPSFSFYAFQALSATELVAEELKERGIKEVVIEGRLTVNGKEVHSFTSFPGL